MVGRAFLSTVTLLW